MILEAGAEAGASWALGLMLFGAGLTGLYTLRVYWLVFGGEARSSLHAHDATPAMRISLVVLTVGTLISWLAAGMFNHLLIVTLPSHDIHAVTLSGMFENVLSTPLTWVVLGIILTGMIGWCFRTRLVWLQQLTRWLASAAENSFGFEWINDNLTGVVKKISNLGAMTQTGLLNWNIVGILVGLFVLLLYLGWSVL